MSSCFHNVSIFIFRARFQSEVNFLVVEWTSEALSAPITNEAEEDANWRYKRKFVNKHREKESDCSSISIEIKSLHRQFPRPEAGKILKFIDMNHPLNARSLHHNFRWWSKSESRVNPTAKEASNCELFVETWYRWWGDGFCEAWLDDTSSLVSFLFIHFCLELIERNRVERENHSSLTWFNYCAGCIATLWM